MSIVGPVVIIVISVIVLIVAIWKLYRACENYKIIKKEEARKKREKEILVFNRFDSEAVAAP